MTSRCTRTRLVAVQRCPAWAKAAAAMLAMARFEVGVREDDGGVLATELGQQADVATGERCLQGVTDLVRTR